MPKPSTRSLRASLGVLSTRLLLLLLLFVPLRTLADSTVTITVDTSAISGTSAQLAFDLINGGSASNTVAISSFSTDGTLGSVIPTGEVSGMFPGTVTLMDSPLSFFNEYLTGITLGNTFAFVFDATTNGPGSGSLPDAFSLFVLDPTTGLPLFSTTDPTGSDALLTLNIDGSALGALSIYQAPGGEVVVTTGSTPAVAEPASFLLLVCGWGLALTLLKLQG